MSGMFLATISNDLVADLEIVILLFIFIWFFAWSKDKLGSAKLAVLFAVIAIYFTFFRYRYLIWIAVGVLILATFGKDLFEKAVPFKS
ncbi:MAG: hypothetical protein V1494_00145 [Candidatus Diapherotrites archaeon]